MKHLTTSKHKNEIIFYVYNNLKNKIKIKIQ